MELEGELEAAGALAGLLSELPDEAPPEPGEAPPEDAPPESPLLEEPEELAASDLPAGFFAEEYRSAYQPPPLNDTAGALSTRSSLPPQCGHTVISGSENFWIFSTRLWHAAHSYS